MQIYTMGKIPGKRVVQVLGMARGNTIRARHVGRDILAGLKMLFGGEITDYTKMMAESREQAIDRMWADGKRMGGNAVLEVRFTTSSVSQGVSELLAYGTAVVLEDDR